MPPLLATLPRRALNGAAWLSQTRRAARRRRRRRRKRLREAAPHACPMLPVSRSRHPLCAFEATSAEWRLLSLTQHKTGHLRDLTGILCDITGCLCQGTEGRADARVPGLPPRSGATLWVQPEVLGRDTVFCLPGHLVCSPISYHAMA